MTVGSKTVGADYSAYQYSKQWNGTDGPHIGVYSDTWHPYSVVVSESSGTMGESQWLPFYANYQGDDPWNSNDDLALLAKLAEAVKGHEFNLAVSAAQGKQTFDLVVNTVVRFTQAALALKKGRIDLALRNLGAPPQKRMRMMYNPKTLTSKDVSAMWLEIQYGWRPLISDVHAASVAYAAIADKMRRSRFSVGYDASGSREANIMNGGYISGVISQTKKSSKRLIVVLTEVPSASRSLGLQDPASVVWELVPFSFVVDWFIPIGTYFEVLATIPFLTGKYLTSYRRVTRTKVVGKTFYTWSGPYTGFEGASSSSYMLQLDRLSTTTLPVPRPKFKSVGDALSPLRIKNAIALLHQVVK